MTLFLIMQKADYYSVIRKRNPTPILHTYVVSLAVICIQGK